MYRDQRQVHDITHRQLLAEMLLASNVRPVKAVAEFLASFVVN